PMSYPMATQAATKHSPASTTATLRSQRRRATPAIATPRRPPSTAPTENPTKDITARAMENPGTPAAANPRKTTLPVMLAVKTRPSPRTLTASTSPVVTVSTLRTQGNGSGRVGVVMMEVSLSDLDSGALYGRLVISTAAARVIDND